MDKNNYFIKEGYKCYKFNKKNQDYINSNYWNEERIFMSKYYQYKVYSDSRQLINQFDIDSVLDIGCGVATKLIEIISPVCNNITGIDSQQAIEYCKSNHKIGNFIIDDLENPTTNPGKFDLIICADVIEHMQNPDNLTEYIRKCSHPNSIIIISTPERDMLRGKDCMSSTKPEHIREWNISEFRSYLEYRGFDIMTHKLIPFIKLSINRKVLKYIAYYVVLRGTINTTQMVVCKIQT